MNHRTDQIIKNREKARQRKTRQEKYIIQQYASKFMIDKNNPQDLSDKALNKAFKNCIIHSTTGLKNLYPKIREEIKGRIQIKENKKRN